MSFLYNLFDVWDSTFLVNMLRVGIPLAEKVLRPIIVYVFLVVLLRIFGKRELAQLNPFDLVVLLSLSNTVQNAIIGDDTSVTGGLVGAFTLCAFNYLVVRFLFKHRRIDQFIEGTPTVLIRDGRIQRKALAAELLTEVELVTMAHRQGFATLDEVEECILEPGGTFYMRGKSPPTHDRRHAELLQRLDELTRQVEKLRETITT
jgi:uncharacterized membrane protein YcaP (DUF421 family)